jgi:PKHD-type hydroxylase
MKLYQLLDRNEANKILAAVKPMEWNEGKARTKELTGTVKQNLEILAKDGKGAKELLKHIAQRIMTNPAVGLDCIPLKAHMPKFSKYVNGGQYHPHTDAPWMAETRTDISFTLWLSDPQTYEGGELVINGEKFKGAQGQAIFYNCGEIHHVNPVTEGERICAVTWIQSRIRDPIKRKTISDFRKWLSKMEDTELYTEGSRIYSSLLKRWMG